MIGEEKRPQKWPSNIPAGTLWMSADSQVCPFAASVEIVIETFNLSFTGTWNRGTRLGGYVSECVYCPTSLYMVHFRER